MNQRRTWLALWLLAFFTVGGVLAPVLHDVHHAEQWQERRSVVHQHASDANAALHEACSVTSVEAQECYLCQRDFLSHLFPAALQHMLAATGVTAPRAPALVVVTPAAAYHIRAPPSA